MKLERMKKIQETLELDNEVIKFEISPTNLFNNFYPKYKKYYELSEKVKSSTIEHENTEGLLEECGNAVIEFYQFIFGEENTDKILKFYEDDYTEMNMYLEPYVTDYIIPKIQKFIVDYQKLRKEQYKK